MCKQSLWVFETVLISGWQKSGKSRQVDQFALQHKGTVWSLKHRRLNQWLKVSISISRSGIIYLFISWWWSALSHDMYFRSVDNILIHQQSKKRIKQFYCWHEDQFLIVWHLYKIKFIHFQSSLDLWKKLEWSGAHKLDLSSSVPSRYYFLRLGNQVFKKIKDFFNP